MAQKRQNPENCPASYEDCSFKYNVATAIGPTQIIVVDFKFVNHLTRAYDDLITKGDHSAARKFLEDLCDSLWMQAMPQTDEE